MKSKPRKKRRDSTCKGTLFPGKIAAVLPHRAYPYYHKNTIQLYTMNPDNYKIMIAEIDRQQQMVKASVFMETLEILSLSYLVN